MVKSMDDFMTMATQLVILPESTELPTLHTLVPSEGTVPVIVIGMANACDAQQLHITKCVCKGQCVYLTCL